MIRRSNPRAHAMRVDMEAEVAAHERGECLSCRTLGRHKADTKCAGGIRLNEYWDEVERRRKNGDAPPPAMEYDLENGKLL